MKLEPSILKKLLVRIWLVDQPKGFYALFHIT